jgi:ribonucleoside-diphosphate reductase alpha chain
VNRAKHTYRLHAYTSIPAEIDLPTKGYENSGKLYQASDYSGECAMCNLGAYVLNTEDTEEDIEKIYYYGVKLTDKTISEMKYPLKSIAYTANMRRSIGIGLTNLAYVIAKNNLSYSSKKGKEFIHSIAERHSYYLHKASLRLGKELGNAPWINKTKYPEGWFPFDNSSKLLDKLDLDLSLKYDWESLRKEIIENKGIRNSVLDSHMPVESSSQITNSTNGLYPVRELVIVKSLVPFAKLGFIFYE